MKYLIMLPMVVAMNVAIADQRIDITDNFCHFVTPEGFATGNDNNEVFAGGCKNQDVHQHSDQNADRVGSGSTIHKIKYPAGAIIFDGEYEFSGAETGVNCVMVDTNGTTYVTQDWDSKYESEVKDLDAFKEAFFTDDEEFDYNEDGIVNYADLAIFKKNAKGEIKYTLVCRNGQQQ